MVDIYVARVYNGIVRSRKRLIAENLSDVAAIKIILQQNKALGEPIHMQSDDVDEKPFLPNVENEDEFAEMLLVVSEHANIEEFNQFLSPDEHIDINDDSSNADAEPSKDTSKRQGKHFPLKKFLTSPGPSVFIALLLIGAGILWPVAAPALVATAIAALSWAAVSLVAFAIPRYLEKLEKKYPDNGEKKVGFLEKNWLHFKEWLLGNEAKNKAGHGWQALIALIGLGLVITAAILVAGFFTGGGAFAIVGGVMIATGGGAFAFMGPVLAAIAGVFSTAALAAGVTEISLVAVTTATLILAALNITDVFRKIAAFLDGWSDDPAKKGEVELVSLIGQPVQSYPGNEEDIAPASKNAGLLVGAFTCDVPGIFRNMANGFVEIFPKPAPKPVINHESAPQSGNNSEDDSDKGFNLIN